MKDRVFLVQFEDAVSVRIRAPDMAEAVRRARQVLVGADRMVVVACRMLAEEP